MNIMYKFKYQIALILLIAITGLSSCQKDKYFFDSGKHNPNYNGSILDYLKSKPQYFQGLTAIIDLAGMKDVFDKEDITFFAPTDLSIGKSLLELNSYLKRNGRDTVSNLNQIKPETWRQVLSLYIFNGSNKLKDYPQVDTLNLAAFPGQGYTSYGGRTMNIGVLFNDASSVKYAGYRQLYLAYIPNFADPKVGLINTPIATSDIKPTNGVLHVLTGAVQRFPGKTDGTQFTLIYKHTFGFSTDLFINTVVSAGILPPTP